MRVRPVFCMTLALAAADPGAGGLLGLSPASPVPAFPWLPTPEPVSWWDEISSQAYWTSPLPWAAVGLVLFSSLAGALVYTLRPSQPTAAEREDRPRPPARVQ